MLPWNINKMLQWNIYKICASWIMNGSTSAAQWSLLEDHRLPGTLGKYTWSDNTNYTQSIAMYNIFLIQRVSWIVLNGTSYFHATIFSHRSTRSKQIVFSTVDKFQYTVLGFLLRVFGAVRGTVNWRSILSSLNDDYTIFRRCGPRLRCGGIAHSRVLGQDQKDNFHIVEIADSKVKQTSMITVINFWMNGTTANILQIKKTIKILNYNQSYSHSYLFSFWLRSKWFDWSFTQYFKVFHLTMTNIVMPENLQPRPSAHCWRFFPCGWRGRQHELSLNFQRPHWCEGAVQLQQAWGLTTRPGRSWCGVKPLRVNHLEADRSFYKELWPKSSIYKIN